MNNGFICSNFSRMTNYAAATAAATIAATAAATIAAAATAAVFT